MRISLNALTQSKCDNMVATNSIAAAHGYSYVVMPVHPLGVSIGVYGGMRRRIHRFIDSGMHVW